jgi:hypothetical protein
VLAEQRREIVARKVALKSATTQAGEFVHEEIRKVRRVFEPTHAIGGVVIVSGISQQGKDARRGSWIDIQQFVSRSLFNNPHLI